MATALHVAIGILLLQMSAYGVENSTYKATELKGLNLSLTDLEGENTTNSQAQISKNEETVTTNNNDQDDQRRQKRRYSFDGFPPYSPVYPTYPSRYNNPINSAFGQEDPFVEIHKRLSDIAAILRQPTMSPVPSATRYPIFLPFLYLPTNNCACAPGEHNRPPQPNPTQTIPTTVKPIPTRPTQQITPSTEVNLPSRGQEIPIDVNATFIESEEDFSRPISFDPIPPNDDIKRRPPPVEHGSVQGNNAPVSVTVTSTTTTFSPPISIDASRYIPSLPTTPDTPSLCDRAIISCCHQVTITYNCFATQGCPDPTLYENPCDTAIILRVIERLQRFYGPRNG